MKIYFLLYGLFLWIALAIAIGMVGSAKGRGGGRYFLGSLLFSPMVVGFVALGIPPKTDQVMPSETVRQRSTREGWLALAFLTLMLGICFLLAYFHQGPA